MSLSVKFSFPPLTTAIGTLILVSVSSLARAEETIMVNQSMRSNVQRSNVQRSNVQRSSNQRSELMHSESLCSECESATCKERVLLFSTRHLPHDVCRISLCDVPFNAWQVDCGRLQRIDCHQYSSSICADRPVVVYVHGNRMPSDEILGRALKVRQTIKRSLTQPVDWLIFSWPSEKDGIAMHDVREKAARCDAQSLYLASLVRTHLAAGTPIAMIGFSFGGRVVTGALHALAGGTLRGHRLPGESIVGANISVGLVAPAIESCWLSSKGYHRRATQNMERLFLMYNPRDAVLKRYWRVERIRNQTALGFSGPSCFAPRFDGSRLPVKSRDYSGTLRLRHAELDYYEHGVGRDFARLISAIGSGPFQLN